MKINFSLKQCAEPECLLIIPLRWLDIPEGYQGKLDIEIILTRSEIVQYLADTRYEFVPISDPRNGAKDESLLHRSELDELFEAAKKKPCTVREIESD